MRFSIVTPSFRQLDWLRLCVASVADQGGNEVEHIIQDAGSEGDFADWPKSQAAVRVYVESDDGMYDAVNRGFRKATGEICAYLNCDEQYLPGALAKVDEFFRAHPDVEVLFGDAILIDQTGDPLSYRRMVLPKLTHIRFAHLNTLTCSTFFRRSILERGFFFDSSWKDIGDAVWVERLLENRVRMATYSEPLAVFTFTGANRSTLSLASQEGAQRGARSPLDKARRIYAIIVHRLRKLMAGAYRSRNLEIDIYTLASPTARQRLHRKSVGFGWPK